jgi:hypothetical protein
MDSTPRILQIAIPGLGCGVGSLLFDAVASERFPKGDPAHFPALFGFMIVGMLAVGIPAALFLKRRKSGKKPTEPLVR